MKANDPMLPTAIMQKIMAHEDFHEVATMVGRNTSGTIYLVGGKVYRTAIELIHGYDCGSRDVDWDWLCVGEVAKKTRAYVENDWFLDDEYIDFKTNSMCLKKYQYQPISKGIPPGGPVIGTKKIDIIGIRDVGESIKRYRREHIVRNDKTPPVLPTGTISDYLYIVPLNIQSIALTTDSAQYPTLVGPKGLSAIEHKTVSINHSMGAWNMDMDKYAKNKSQSIKFKYGQGGAKVPCDCYSGNMIMLWNNGCQSKLTHC